MFVVPAYSRPELYISLWSQKTYKYHICDHSCLNYHYIVEISHLENHITNNQYKR